MTRKITAEDGLKKCHKKAMARNGQLLSNYQTASEAAVKIGVSNCLISKVLSGKSKHTRGYKLEFLSETA